MVYEVSAALARLTPREGVQIVRTLTQLSRGVNPAGLQCGARSDTYANSAGNSQPVGQKGLASRTSPTMKTALPQWKARLEHGNRRATLKLASTVALRAPQTPGCIAC